jgi:hypothetical protein
MKTRSSTSTAVRPPAAVSRGPLSAEVMSRGWEV